MTDDDRADRFVSRWWRDGEPDGISVAEGNALAVELAAVRADERRICTAAAGAVVEAQIRIDDDKDLAVIDRMIDLEWALRRHATNFDTFAALVRPTCPDVAEAMTRCATDLRALLGVTTPEAAR
jgi:hypothetical protein